MARPIRNTVDYFPHPCTHGKKMHFIESQYGNDGYATWFKLLEEMGNSNNHYLDLNEDVTILYLSSRCHIEENKLICPNCGIRIDETNSEEKEVSYVK